MDDWQSPIPPQRDRCRPRQSTGPAGELWGHICEYICGRPHGSYREGIKSRSQLAIIWCLNGRIARALAANSLLWQDAWGARLPLGEVILERSAVLESTLRLPGESPQLQRLKIQFLLKAGCAGAALDRRALEVSRSSICIHALLGHSEHSCGTPTCCQQKDDLLRLSRYAFIFGFWLRQEDDDPCWGFVR